MFQKIFGVSKRDDPPKDKSERSHRNKATPKPVDSAKRSRSNPSKSSGSSKKSGLDNSNSAKKNRVRVRSSASSSAKQATKEKTKTRTSRTAHSRTSAREIASTPKSGRELAHSPKPVRKIASKSAHKAPSPQKSSRKVPSSPKSGREVASIKAGRKPKPHKDDDSVDEDPILARGQLRSQPCDIVIGPLGGGPPPTHRKPDIPKDHKPGPPVHPKSGIPKNPEPKPHRKAGTPKEFTPQSSRKPSTPTAGSLPPLPLTHRKPDKSKEGGKVVVVSNPATSQTKKRYFATDDSDDEDQSLHASQVMEELQNGEVTPKGTPVERRRGPSTTKAPTAIDSATNAARLASLRANRPQPKEIPKNQKEEKISKGILVKGRHDYPTMGDIMSDWDTYEDKDRDDGADAQKKNAV